MKNAYKLLPIVFVFIGLWANAQESSEVINYKLTQGVIYGQSKVLDDGKEVMIDLWMDVYEPIESSIKPLPAVILSHGGSFLSIPGKVYTAFGAKCTTPLVIDL